eukprot:Gb_14231 [translate_table: standard]
MNEAMVASTNEPDKFLMALWFQEMLENQFSSESNEWKDAQNDLGSPISIESDESVDGESIHSHYGDDYSNEVFSLTVGWKDAQDDLESPISIGSDKSVDDESIHSHYGDEYSDAVCSLTVGKQGVCLAENHAHCIEEWRGVVEEYGKLSVAMKGLNLEEENEVCEEFEGVRVEEEEWNDAVEDFSTMQRDSGKAEDDEYNESSSGFGVEDGFFSLYFKGVSEIRTWESRLGQSASGIGVVICKPSGEMFSEVQKKLGFYVDQTVAEHLALIDGLLAALDRGLTRVNAFTDSELVYDQIARGRGLENQLLLAVRQRVMEHVRMLDDFMLTLNVRSDDSRNAMFLARTAIYPTSYGSVFVPLRGKCEYSLGSDDIDSEDDDVLFQGLGQKRQRRYSHKGTPGCFNVTSWGEAPEFNQPYPSTQALGLHSWREREKGIGEWKFA